MIKTYLFVIMAVSPLTRNDSFKATLGTSIQNSSLNQTAELESMMSDNLKHDNTSNLENFDNLFVGDPAEIEKNLRMLLPRAEVLEDMSIYLQILSQIALTQAMQKNFEAAHETLNVAEKLLTSKDHLARVRIILERGRVFMQSGNNEAARPLFEQSFDLSKEHEFDYHTINAAHMMPFVVKTVEEKMKWNELAIQLAEQTSLPRAKGWLGALYNNLGQAYLESEQYEKALNTFKKAQVLREKEGYLPNVRVAKWAVARTLRLLNRADEALCILLSLMEEYDFQTHSGKLDLPEEMHLYTRGLVYEELAEVYIAKAKLCARLAYEGLSNNEWVQRLEPKKLERLKQLQTQND